MPRTIRLPSPEELPPGSVRTFVVELFAIYREAHRPPLRRISEVTAEGDLPGTVSPETIRKMLRGAAVPPSWQTVAAVLEALCHIAGRNPDAEFYIDDRTDVTSTRRLQLERAWHRALDFPDERYELTASSDEPRTLDR